jgi:hypothetical protein
MLKLGLRRVVVEHDNGQPITDGARRTVKSFKLEWADWLRGG